MFDTTYRERLYSIGLAACREANADIREERVASSLAAFRALFALVAVVASREVVASAGKAHVAQRSARNCGQRANVPAALAAHKVARRMHAAACAALEAGAPSLDGASSLPF